jgi:uncharacterized membrane protein
MSDRMLRRVMIVITVIGIGVTAYLTIAHYDRTAVLCASTSGANSCEAVQTSVYSHILGIPVALIGLIGYVAIAGALFAPDRDGVRLATLGMALFGFAFSGYLTYREAFTLHEYCEWCLSSAFLITVIFILSVIRYLRGAPFSGAPSPARGGS